MPGPSLMDSLMEGASARDRAEVGSGKGSAEDRAEVRGKRKTRHPRLHEGQLQESLSSRERWKAWEMRHGLSIRSYRESHGPGLQVHDVKRNGAVLGQVRPQRGGSGFTAHVGKTGEQTPWGSHPDVHSAAEAVARAQGLERPKGIPASTGPRGFAGKTDTSHLSQSQRDRQRDRDRANKRIATANQNANRAPGTAPVSPVGGGGGPDGAALYRRFSATPHGTSRTVTKALPGETEARAIAAHLNAQPGKTRYEAGRSNGGTGSWFVRAVRPGKLKEAADSLAKASTPEPFSTSKTSNWVARAGGLPPYIQHIAHDIHEKRGKTVSEAIRIAIGVVKNWAHGHGNVDAGTKAAAVKALAEWTAMKAKAAAGKLKNVVKEMEALEVAAALQEELAADLLERLWAELTPDGFVKLAEHAVAQEKPTGLLAAVDTAVMVAEASDRPRLRTGKFSKALLQVKGHDQLMRNLRKAGHAGSGAERRRAAAASVSAAVYSSPALGESATGGEPDLLARVKGLKKGEHARLSDGHAVRYHSTEDGRDVWSAGRPRSYSPDGMSWNEMRRTPEEAVADALTMSAASTDPASLGGRSPIRSWSPLMVDGREHRLVRITPEGQAEVRPYADVSPTVASSTRVVPIGRVQPRLREEAPGARLPFPSLQEWTYDPSQKRAPKGAAGGGRFVSQNGGGSDGDVRAIQKKLGIKKDGKFGTQTKTAVEAFQRAHNLVVDGIVGHQTATALAGAGKTAKPGTLQKGDLRKVRKSIAGAGLKAARKVSEARPEVRAGLVPFG